MYTRYEKDVESQICFGQFQRTIWSVNTTSKKWRQSPNCMYMCLWILRFSWNVFSMTYFAKRKKEISILIKFTKKEQCLPLKHPVRLQSISFHSNGLKMCARFLFCIVGLIPLTSSWEIRFDLKDVLHKYTALTRSDMDLRYRDDTRKIHLALQQTPPGLIIDLVEDPSFFDVDPKGEIFMCNGTAAKLNSDEEGNKNFTL